MKPSLRPLALQSGKPPRERPPDQWSFSLSSGRQVRTSSQGLVLQARRIVCWNRPVNNIDIFLTLTGDIKYFKYFNGKKKVVTFWGAIKLYFQINMTKALILNVMPDTIMVKYVNYEILISLYDLKYSVNRI